MLKEKFHIINVLGKNSFNSQEKKVQREPSYKINSILYGGPNSGFPRASDGPKTVLTLGVLKFRVHLYSI